MTDTICGYRLLELTGTGPLGDAYRARDTRHGRTVTLTLVPQSIAGVAARREELLKDAKAASALSHPLIAALWEVGEQDGQLFLAFEHVNGRTLSALVGGRPMDARRAIDIAIQLADALDAAWSKGFVHQDLNPWRVILTPVGQIKILDFGFAAWTRNGARHNGSASPSRHATERTGAADIHVSDKFAYLSPEQVLGERVDHRSDIFSLGTILYEMLTGQAPFNGASPDETALKVVQASLPPPSSLNASVPPELDAIVARALLKSLDARYQASSAMAADLRVVAAAMDGGTPVVERTDGPTISFRPFLRVAAILLALAFTGVPAWLLRGEIHRLWGHWRQPTAPVARIAAPRIDPVAQDLYLQGKAAADRRDRSRAIALYEQAIARDPGLSAAQAGLAEALYLEAFYAGGHPDPTTSTRARRAAEAAVTSDPNLPQAQLVVGLTAPTLAESLAHLRRAIELDPSFANAYHQVGDQIVEIDPARAIAFYRKSLEFDPALDANLRDLASAYDLLDRTDDAEREIALGRTARPDRPWWNQMQARIDLGRRRYAQSIAALARDPATESAPVVWLMGRVVPLQLSGRTREAVQAATRMTERYPWFCEGRAVLSGLRLQIGPSAEAQAAIAGIQRDAEKADAPAGAIVCAATAAASVSDAGRTALWLRRVAGDELALRLWMRQAVFSPNMAYRHRWYPWNGVAERPTVREAWSEVEGGVARLRSVIARELDALTFPSDRSLGSK